MIPKRLFFVWIGNDKPNYIDFSIKTFKEVNPDFEIVFINYNIDQFENLDLNTCKNEYDRCAYDVLQMILNKSKYRTLITWNYKAKRLFRQLYVNVFRLELISRFGGIYLDCDTFPNKPFDLKLLNKNEFNVFTFNGSHYSKNKPMLDEVYFIGSNGENVSYRNVGDIKNKTVTYNYDYRNDKKWIEDRNNFFNCKLNYIEKYKDNNHHYIEHYEDYAWNPERMTSCKYDKIFKMW